MLILICVTTTKFKEMDPVGTELLSEEEKEKLVHLAVMVERGDVPIEALHKLFKVRSKYADAIILFWQEYNDITRALVNKIMIHLTREYLELCLQLSPDEEDE